MPKTIELELIINPNSLYSSNNKPSIGFCSKIANGKVKQLTVFHTCRETLVNEFRSFVRASMIPGSVDSNTKHLWSRKKIPVDKARLIFLKRADAKTPDTAMKRKATFTKAMRQGVKMANLIEENAGWSKTKLYPVKITKWLAHGGNGYADGRRIDNEEKANIYLTAFVVEGTIRWFNSPYLLSLWSLLIRAGAFPATARIRTHKGLVDKLTTVRRDHVLNNKNHLEGKRCSGPDTNLILQSFDVWTIITKYYSTIFKGRKMTDNYAKTAMKGSYVDSEGIHVLSQGKGSDPLIKKRIKEICTKKEIPLDIYIQRKYK